MSRDRIDKKTLEEQLPAILREQLQRDGMSTDTVPSWEYITAHTRYTAEGLNNKCKEIFDETLHDFLREQGFGVLAGDDRLSGNKEVRESINYVRESMENENKLNWSDETVSTVMSAFRKAYECIEQEEITYGLLELGRAETAEEKREKKQAMISILSNMNAELDDETTNNYSLYLSWYYDLARNKYEIDFNPVEKALVEFDFSHIESESDAPSVNQIRDLWNALDALDECPIHGYDLEEWRVWMKALILVLTAIGPRSSEVEQLDIDEQFQLGDDPHVRFETRKNLDEKAAPQHVPIMCGDGWLEAYVQYISDKYNHSTLVPSDESESGCRTASTLNRWLRRLWDEADLTWEGDDEISMKNFRKFWTTRYKESLHENLSEFKIVAKEEKAEKPEVKRDNYMDSEKNREHIRDVVRDDFEAAIPYGAPPEIVRETIDEEPNIDRQTRVSDFNSDD